MERSARRVGTSVLVKASEYPEADSSKGKYALIIMIMLIEVSGSYGIQKGYRDEEHTESTMASTAGMS